MIDAVLLAPADLLLIATQTISALTGRRSQVGADLIGPSCPLRRSHPVLIGRDLW